MTNYTGAIIKCFYDEDCTLELDKQGTAYVYHIGPESGFNGTDGDSTKQSIFIANKGDTDATDITIQKTGINGDLFRFSVNNSITKLSIKTIKLLQPNEVKQMYIYSFIPAESQKETGVINFTILYNTIPAITDIKYYQDNKDSDYLTLVTEGQDNTLEEYTLKTISSEENVPLTPPVTVISGAKDQITYDDTDKKYKISLQCPWCGKWTDKHNLDDYDSKIGEQCSQCHKPVKSGVTVNTIGKEKGLHIETNTKVSFTADQWIKNTITGMYEYTVKEPGLVCGIYKKNISGKYGYVGSNCTKKNSVNTLVSLDAYEGYCIIANDTLGKLLSKQGRSFGYGPYGEPLYGQEGLLHLQDGINMEVAISGQKAVVIVGNYDILEKYNGTEANIEDIQSSYTYRYMMLGCYDGPALPLWLGKHTIKVFIDKHNWEYESESNIYIYTIDSKGSLSKVYKKNNVSGYEYITSKCIYGDEQLFLYSDTPYDGYCIINVDSISSI